MKRVPLGRIGDLSESSSTIVISYVSLCFLEEDGSALRYFMSILECSINLIKPYLTDIFALVRYNYQNIQNFFKEFPQR
jgi:hypothetical protein